MTNKEAIELLYDIQTDAVYNVLSSEKEALGMAINVLKQQPCEDCISRQAVKETIFIQGSAEKLEIDFAKLLLLQRAIKALPSVTPQPKIGKWVDIGNEGLVFKCSLCGDKNMIESHFCPNCGARMEAETKIEQGLNFGDQDTMMPAT